MKSLHRLFRWCLLIIIGLTYQKIKAATDITCVAEVSSNVTGPWLSPATMWSNSGKLEMASPPKPSLHGTRQPCLMPAVVSCG